MDNCNDTEVLQAGLYLNHLPFRVMMVVHILSNMGSIGTNFFFWIRVFRLLFLPPHIKILLKAQLSCNLILAFFTASLSIFHLYFFSTAENSCDILVSSLFCAFFKVPTDAAICAIILLNTAVVVERLLATVLLKTFESSKTRFGLILCTIAGFISLSCSLYMHWGVNYNTRVPYCASSSPSTLQPTFIVSSSFAFTETLAIIAFFILRVINLRLRNRKKFVVGLRYQLDENVDVTRVFLPWMLLHLMFILGYYAAFIIVPRSSEWTLDTEMHLRTAIGYSYLMLIAFGGLSPLFMWTVFVWMRRKRQRRIATVEKTATGDQYYDAYRHLW